MPRGGKRIGAGRKRILDCEKKRRSRTFSITDEEYTRMRTFLNSLRNTRNEKILKPEPEKPVSIKEAHSDEYERWRRRVEKSRMKK